MTRVALCLLLSVAALAHAEDAPAKPSAAELKQLGKVADEWIKLARWCVPKRLGNEARAAVELARAASPRAKLTRIQGQAEACADAASDGNRATYAGRHERTCAKVAKLYDKLARATRRLDVGRADGYLWAALRTERSDARWKQAGAILHDAVTQKDAARITAFRARVAELNPPEPVLTALRAAEDVLAEQRMVLRQASNHPLRYYLSLPEGYDPQAERSWPVLVCVSGAGSNFKGFGESYRKQRGDLPLLIVSPCTFANTNAIEGKTRERYRAWYPDPGDLDRGIAERMDFDLAGLLVVLDDLQARYKAAPQVYVTGFSGGGRLTYKLLFTHPERVAAAAPACGNFNPQDARGGEPSTPEARALPIHLITGAEDPHRTWTHGKEGSPGIEAQTDWAEEALKAQGYPHYVRTLVDGLKHSPAVKRVLDVFRPYVLGERQRSEPLPR